MTVDPSSAPFWLGNPRAHQSLSPIHMPQTVDTQSLTVIVQLDTEPMLLGAAVKFFCHLLYFRSASVTKSVSHPVRAALHI